MYRMPPTSALTCGKPGKVMVYRRPPMRSLYSKRATRKFDPFSCCKRHALYAPETPPPTTATSRSMRSRPLRVSRESVRDNADHLPDDRSRSRQDVSVGQE